MPYQGAPYLNPEVQTETLKAFIAKHVRPYDPPTDEYDRPSFAADIKEGKNDPIYNAHSYHTKVPPRSIIPYILHYTQSGDVVLDPFCGSGMTGVAAQMCADPPTDLLVQFPELADRIGPRACILNDLSPAACHIAYNYNTPVDVAALRNVFERIKATVKEEFNWLYGTEHYEPAIGLYDPTNADVAARLKNAPATRSLRTLLGGEERTWELLTKAEVERRLGYSVTELPRDDAWAELDVSEIKQWVCIPATIQYTIWSDAYRCEGFVGVEEATGKVSTRGKNVGKPIMKRRSVQRGCRKEFRLWDVGIDLDSREVRESFNCPWCDQEWTTENATLLRTEATSVIYEYGGFKKKHEIKTRRAQRKLTNFDGQRLKEIVDSAQPYWYPTIGIVAGEQGNPFLNRGIGTVDQFWTPRNLRALARLWSEFSQVSDPRVREALRFLFTSVSVGICSKMTRYNFGKRGNGAMAMRLFFPHFQAEANVLKVLSGKVDDIVGYYTPNHCLKSMVEVSNYPAQDLSLVPDSSVDFIFADPPFGRNIAYAELNILWEAWLGSTTDVSKEAITSSGRKWGVESYADKMRGAFREMYRVLKPGRFALVEFNNSDPELRLFEQIKLAAVSAGFEICGMAILDKQHKSYNQAVGAIRGEDTVDKDVVFNLRRPPLVPSKQTVEDHDLERQVVDVVREHLSRLPDRIKVDPAKYSDEHRTGGTIHSVLMNSLIPRGVSVERLNLQFIERVCTRYFRKVGQHWYLRGESVGGGNGNSLIEERVNVKDEITAIAWLRLKVQPKPMLIGELKPLWMRATGLLPAAVSQELSLEMLLSENFWRDPDSNRWREPTDEEREKMNDDRSIRVLHDAERYVAGSLHRTTSDEERCEWIEVLFKACRQVEDGDMQSVPALRGFDAGEGYRLITRLFQSVMREKVPAEVHARSQKQAGAASSRISQSVRDDDELRKAELAKSRGPSLFDEVD
jgi:hypothetical protein